jgi:hypothetical protein
LIVDALTGAALLIARPGPQAAAEFRILKIARCLSLKTSVVDSQRTVSQAQSMIVQYMIWDEPSARTKASLLRCGSRSRHSVISLTQNEGTREVFNSGLTTTEDLSRV